MTFKTVLSGEDIIQANPKSYTSCVGDNYLRKEIDDNTVTLMREDGFFDAVYAVIGIHIDQESGFYGFGLCKDINNIAVAKASRAELFSKSKLADTYRDISDFAQCAVMNNTGMIIDV